MTEVKQPITEEQALERFKAVFNEIYDLEADLKEIVEEVKEAELDAAGLKEIAKAIVYNKLGSLSQKLKDRLELIERVA